MIILDVVTEMVAVVMMENCGIGMRSGHWTWCDEMVFSEVIVVVIIVIFVIMRRSLAN